MSMLFSRRAIIPVWPIVFGLLALLGSPLTFATRVVLLLAGGLALTITLVRWGQPPPTIAATTIPDPPRARLSSADVMPNSWPNSGFRNIRQRGARGG